MRRFQLLALKWEEIHPSTVTVTGAVDLGQRIKDTKTHAARTIHTATAAAAAFTRLHHTPASTLADLDPTGTLEPGHYI